MGTVTLLPTAAVDRICHDEQMTVWSGDFVGALSLHGFLRELEYHEVCELHDIVAREIRSIIRMALDHPEARTVMKV
ncbi:hypothetical protein [Mesorhizobium sp. WSM3626]|uniref:hypothetical protein n=1 Tax=Mesorhizobium sp. WSM3626 TaxID=1040987 RepID=UPI0004872AED|nr:hypothetical protein [Mesorhizobium sp. WSM3626]